MRAAQFRSMVSAVVVAILLVVMVPSTNATADECGRFCHVATGHDDYVGSLLLPPTTQGNEPGLVAAAARCAGCVWKLSPACLTATADPDLLCVNATASCPPPGILTTIWLQRPTELAPSRVGAFCHEPGQLLTPDQYLPGVRDQFIKLLPGLAVTYQPAGRSLVNLPTLFATHQPGDLGRPTFALGGHPIGLTATARWTVDFGDGTTSAYDRPGGAYPNDDIAHPYAHPGTYPVTVTTTWTGQFTVDGLGPFPVTGPDITQRQTVQLPVKEARAILVG